METQDFGWALKQMRFDKIVRRKSWREGISMKVDRPSAQSSFDETRFMMWEDGRWSDKNGMSVKDILGMDWEIEFYGEKEAI